MEEEIRIDLQDDNHEIIIEEIKDDEIGIQNDNVVYKTVMANDYNELKNKPLINYVTLEDNKTLGELGIQEKGDYANSRITNTELEGIFNDW